MVGGLRGDYATRTADTPVAERRARRQFRVRSLTLQNDDGRDSYVLGVCIEQMPVCEGWHCVTRHVPVLFARRTDIFSVLKAPLLAPAPPSRSCPCNVSILVMFVAVGEIGHPRQTTGPAIVFPGVFWYSRGEGSCVQLDERSGRTPPPGARQERKLGAPSFGTWEENSSYVHTQSSVRIL